MKQGFSLKIVKFWNTLIWDTVHAQNLYCFKGRLDIFIGKKSITGKLEYIEITFTVKCVWVSSTMGRTLGMMYLVSSYNLLFLKVHFFLHSYFLGIHFGPLSEAGYWARLSLYSYSHNLYAVKISVTFLMTGSDITGRSSIS